MSTSTSHCPVCAGDSVPLGSLGNLLWFRCRDCGMTYSRPASQSAASDDAENNMDDTVLS